MTQICAQKEQNSPLDSEMREILFCFQWHSYTENSDWSLRAIWHDRGSVYASLTETFQSSSFKAIPGQKFAKKSESGKIKLNGHETTRQRKQNKTPLAWGL